VQNIMVFRFANGLFEPIWNRRYVDHVQMLVAETVGVEDRGNYYETAGVLRDMIQNHISRCSRSSRWSRRVVRPGRRTGREGEGAEVHPAHGAGGDPHPHGPRAVRRGHAGGKKLAGYRTETKVSPTSGTETYAALKLFIENWRWAGIAVLYPLG